MAGSAGCRSVLQSESVAHESRTCGSPSTAPRATVVAAGRQTILMATMLAPFRVLIAHRQAIQIFVNRDIRGRYINSALGLWWAVIQPLALLALYTFVFSSVMRGRLDESGVPESSRSTVFCGLLPWLAVADALTRSSSVLLEQTPLIKKVVFPTEILPVHLVLSALIVEIVGLAVFLAVVMIGGRLPGWSLLIAAVRDGAAVLVHDRSRVAAVDARAVSAGRSPGRRSRADAVDVPDADCVSRVHGAGAFRWVLDINPMTAIVGAYRAALLDDRMPARSTSRCSPSSRSWLVRVGALVVHAIEADLRRSALMSSSAIEVDRVSKAYRLYPTPVIERSN